MKIIMSPHEYVKYFLPKDILGCVVELTNGETVVAYDNQTDGYDSSNSEIPCTKWTHADGILEHSFAFPHHVQSISLSPQLIKQLTLRTTLSNIKDDVAGIVDKF
jgi:hypothetical protein